MDKLPWTMMFGLFFGNWLLVPIFRSYIFASEPPDFFRGFFTGLISAIILAGIYSLGNLFRKKE